MLRDGKPEFCAGCPAKGDFCGPIETESVRLRTTGDAPRGNDLSIRFQDVDGLDSCEVAVYDFSIDINNIGHFTKEKMLNIGDSIADLTIRRIGRCSGVGPGYCPAFSKEAVEKLGQNITSTKPKD